MNEQQMHDFHLWMQTHTAIGRLGLGEVRAAFERAASAGYVVTKMAPQPEKDA